MRAWVNPVTSQDYPRNRDKSQLLQSNIDSIVSDISTELSKISQTVNLNGISLATNTQDILGD